MTRREFTELQAMGAGIPLPWSLWLYFAKMVCVREVSQEELEAAIKQFQPPPPGTKTFADLDLAQEPAWRSESLSGTAYLSAEDLMRAPVGSSHWHDRGEAATVEDAAENARMAVDDEEW